MDPVSEGKSSKKKIRVKSAEKEVDSEEDYSEGNVTLKSIKKGKSKKKEIELSDDSSNDDSNAISIVYNSSFDEESSHSTPNKSLIKEHTRELRSSEKK